MTLTHANPFGSCLGFLSAPLKAPVAVAVADPSEMNVKLVAALKKKQEQFRQKFDRDMSFTSYVRHQNGVRRKRHEQKRSHRHVRAVSGHERSQSQPIGGRYQDALQAGGLYEDKQLTLKQFLVVLAMGYVLDAIPDLLEDSAQQQRAAAARASGRRMSNFHDKEDTVREALELFTYAYLLFDKECTGVISRQQVMFVVAEEGQKDTGSMSILSQERWEEMDWDSNGDISFGEFVYAFTKWVDVEAGDEDTVEHNKKSQATAEAGRQGGRARRKSSVSVARRTSVKAKEIGRRLSFKVHSGSEGNPGSGQIPSSSSNVVAHPSPGGAPSSTPQVTPPPHNTPPVIENRGSSGPPPEGQTAIPPNPT